MKIIILGGGISGLSGAWFLRRIYPHAEILVLEKQNRLGGWIQTGIEKGILFEKGPRTFALSRSPHLLDLIRDTGLEKELIFSDPCASNRYLWSKGRLRSVSSFFPRMLLSLLCEPFRARGTADDESVYTFAKRRFGSHMAETLFDALSLGIYAASSQELSMRSCFPFFFELERKKGSLFLPLLFSKKNSSGKGLFTLRSGMSTLIDRLAEKSKIETICNCAVEEIHPDSVVANGIRYHADLIVSALPGQVIGRLSGLWNPFPRTDLWVANLAYEGNVLSKKGFGYLVPSKEKDNVLGMVWDSQIFPQQGHRGETRLSVMMREGSVKAAEEAVQRHLGIKQSPLFAYAFFAKSAIPRFVVGHAKILAQFEQAMKAKFPNWILLGNYLEKGPSVESCVATAFEKIISSDLK